jgi:hypothetical protein
VGVEHGQEQLVLAGEVRVDGALGVAGVLGDLLQRRTVKATPQEHVARGGHDVGSGLLLARTTREPLPHLNTPRTRKPSSL